jgi:hypothetical protein
MRQNRKPQVCDRCGRRFGMLTHRWWGNKFCKRSCKDAYLREVALDRAAIARWFGVVSFTNSDAKEFVPLSTQPIVFGVLP